MSDRLELGQENPSLALTRTTRSMEMRHFEETIFWRKQKDRKCERKARRGRRKEHDLEACEIPHDEGKRGG